MSRRFMLFQRWSGLEARLTWRFAPSPCRKAGVRAFVLAIFVLPAIGCATDRPFADLWVQPRPYHAQERSAQPPASALEDDGDATPESADAETNPTGELTLRDAVVLALQQNPALASAGWGSAAAEADARQMGRPPNPHVTFAAENFAGPDGGDLFENQTLRISQVIELADKRARRLALGHATQRLRAWDYEEQRIEVASLAASRYVAVVVSQQGVGLAREQLTLAQAGFDVAQDRVANGTAPGFEQDQAAARVALRRIALEQAQQHLAAARADLAASWGAPFAAFTVAVGELDTRVDLPGLESLQTRLSQSPSVARWGDEIAQREATLALARANATADPTAGVGLRYFPEADDAAGVFEVSWPLTVFDDNRDAVLAARLRVSQADRQRAQAYAEASQALARAYARQRAADFALHALDEEALPASQRAYDAALESYTAGLTDYLTVLDAERTLLEIRERRLEAAKDYHTAVIEIEQITAQALEGGAE